MLHQLNEDQLNLVNEFKSSGLTFNDFAKAKNIGIHQIVYLVRKEKLLKEQDDNLSLDSYIPVKFNNELIENNNSNSNLINVYINGFNISINLNDLKELLK